jgi:hypothetical protein
MQPPPSGPRKMMLSSITSTEPAAHDWLYVHSPSVSALAGFANSAKTIAGMMISHLLRKLPLTNGTHSVPQLNLPRHKATALFALFSQTDKFRASKTDVHAFIGY